MSDVALRREGEMILRSITDVAELTCNMLQLPQADCPVVHHFAPGICVREVSLPAGLLAVGHTQKFAHLNVVLRGRVMMLGDDGALNMVAAPCIFTGGPGRKVGYVLEDTVWQNIYATDLKDVNDIEAHFIDKSETWQEHHAAMLTVQHVAREVDRFDYYKLLEDLNVTDEAVQAEVQCEDSVVAVMNSVTRVSDSPIHGKGLFLTSPVEAGAVICPARLNGHRTQAGRYVNHSINPNCEMRTTPSGDVDLVALVGIGGCRGGDAGTELTVNYREALKTAVAYASKEPQCQPS